MRYLSVTYPETSGLPLFCTLFPSR